MSRQRPKKSKKGSDNDYISLKEATKYCSYSQEYLGLRARQGKLKAVKIGKDWATKKEWLEKYSIKVGEQNKEYISLEEATKYCSYSQEYLSLRARQGKIKAVKIRRSWVTKREWLEEYLVRVEGFNNNIKDKRVEKVLKLKEIKPVCRSPAEQGEFDEKKITRVRSPLVPVLRFVFVTALVFVLIIAVGILGKSSLANIFHQTSPYVERIRKAGDIIIEKTARNINQSFTAVFEDISYLSENTYINGVSVKDISQGTSETFKEYFQWLSSNIKTHAVALRNTIANSEFAQSFTVSIKSIRRYLLHLD